MNVTSVEVANSTAAIRRQISMPTKLWAGVLLVLLTRTLFFVLAQSLVALIFALQHHPTPWQASAAWWPADGVLANLLGLALLFVMTRRERMSLWALVSFDRRRLFYDIWLGLGLFLITFPVAFAGMTLAGILFYGSYSATPIVGGHLPLWAGLVGVMVFPYINGVTEQMTYSGYVLPRYGSLDRQNIPGCRDRRVLVCVAAQRPGTLVRLALRTLSLPFLFTAVHRRASSLS
jgi:hypothetical protein